MKLTKMLGLAAVAALASMAFVGAGTASATVLCKEKPEKVEGKDVCPTGQVYGDVEAEPQNPQTPHPVKLTLKPETEALFASQNEPQEFLIQCNESSIAGEVTTPEQVEGQVTEDSFTNNEGKCPTGAGVNLEFLVKNLPYLITVTYEGQQVSQDGTEEVGYGKVTAEEKPGAGPIGFAFRQGLFECNYKLKPIMEGRLGAKLINGSAASQTSQVVFDGTQAQFELDEEQNNAFGCERSFKIVATYNLTGEQNGEQINLYIAQF